MTPEERARQVIVDTCGTGMWSALMLRMEDIALQAIRAAVAEEREACALAAIAEVSASDNGKTMKHKAWHPYTAAAIAAAIRARSV